VAEPSEFQTANMGNTEFVVGQNFRRSRFSEMQLERLM